MLPQWLIEKTRDGRPLSDAEITELVDGFTRGRIPDYQMAAWAMAVYFRGLTPPETAALTRAMLATGDRLHTEQIPHPKVDKHSTGGVGDKISIILAPLAAACGMAVPMISGRGLGLTGGTLDKLESIPGYRTNLSPAEFLDIVATCGCSIIGQTDRLAPADRKLYALRDVTGTVPSIPLITASILSKKLAEGLDALVLDVKFGSGAFMQSAVDAEQLARSLLAVASQMGLRTAALLTDMNEPLGHAVGNALEIRECLAVLHGQGPEDVLRLTYALGVEMLLLAGVVPDAAQAETRLKQALTSGAALERFRDMLRLHGSAAAVADEPNRLPTARHQLRVVADQAGFVSAVDAERVGRAALLLGAGRTKTEDRVDHAAGVSNLVKVGMPVQKGSPLAVLHTNSPGSLPAARDMLVSGLKVSDQPPPPRRLVLKRLESASC